MEFTGTRRFELLGKLGEGGMGIVYEAFDRTRGMPVALKTLRNVDAESLQRFKREFRALQNLSHPNIIHLYEMISEDGAWFLTMELLRGQDFIKYVRGYRTVALSGVAQNTSAQDTRTLQGPCEAAATLHVHGDDAASILPALPAVTRAVDEVVDITRLRAALGQLADALYALHSANMVHRDLKPDNVRVTPDGRVVLMDFGIVGELSRRRGAEPGTSSAAGTPSYMAPEQVHRNKPKAAADWYSFGVLMYNALAGRLPFDGDRLDIMRLKSEVDPWPPSRFTSGLPADLEALCMALLAREPGRRPSGVEVLDRLGMAVSDAAISGEFPVLDAVGDLFVGRRRELDTLRGAYARIRVEGTSCIFIEGPSGIGRSSLVRRFVYELRSLGGRRPIVLFGHSRARESVAYKAFDGVIDDLSSYLRGLSEGARRELLDEDSSAIAWLFPSLRRALGLDDAGRDDVGFNGADDAQNPHERRAGAIVALRALLTRVARGNALVLCTDDVQWADRDSLDLLLALVRRPAPSRLLVLATLRTGEHESAELGPESHLQRVIDTMHGEIDCQHLLLGPLSESEQRELMVRMASLPEFQGVSRHLEAPLWRESAGNPMLLAELARSTSDTPHDLAARGLLHLDDVIWSRFRKLSDDARALMECIVLAGEPLPLKVLADASELSSIACERASSTLRVSHMASIERSDYEPWLVAYHYKVCEAIKQKLAPDRKRRLHRRLAHALEAWGEAPRAQLAEQWLGAGEVVKAAYHRFEAARQSARLLALERAAELYQATLDLLPEPCPDQELSILCCRARIGLVESMLYNATERDRAFELLEQAERAAAEHGLLSERSLIHHLRGSLHFPHGDLDRCLVEHELARRYARQTSSSRLEVLSVSGEGDAHYARGRMLSAHARFEECLVLCREHDMQDAAVNNRAMRALTGYFQNDLAGALRDSHDAAEEAARIRYQRTELIARCFPMPWALFDMGRVHQAGQALERALDLCHKLGSRRYEPMVWMQQARILSMKGRRRRAQELAVRAVESCREQGATFLGPVALGLLARVTSDDSMRHDALKEAEDILSTGAWSHCHLFFYRDAMDLGLESENSDVVARYADALERYTAAEPLPWSQFFIARARALDEHRRGRGSRETLSGLRNQARKYGLHTPAKALDAALTQVREPA